MPLTSHSKDWSSESQMNTSQFQTSWRTSWTKKPLSSSFQEHMRSSLQRDSSLLQDLSRRNTFRFFKSSSWKVCIIFILFPSIASSTRASSTNSVLPSINCLKVWTNHQSSLWFASPSNHQFTSRIMTQRPTKASSKVWLSTTTELISTKTLSFGSISDQSSPNLMNQISTRMLQSSQLLKNIDPSSNQLIYHHENNFSYICWHTFSKVY